VARWAKRRGIFLRIVALFCLRDDVMYLDKEALAKAASEVGLPLNC
jgi:hypothetical protein